jgi:hypothetical protein
VKGLRVFLVSIGVCVFVGIPVSTFFFGVVSGTPSLAVRVDIAGVPILAYGFISGFPFALVAGLLGGSLVLALLRSKRWNPAWQGWVLACAVLGTLTASGVTVLMWTTGWVEEAGVPTLFGFVGPSGGLCGALLGLYLHLGEHIKVGSG